MHDPLVICYHALSESWDAALSVTPSRFRAQVEYLLARGYRGVTFNDATEAAPGARVFAITFDDAFRSVLELGSPILDRLGVPGTVFIPTAFPGRDELSWKGIDHWRDGPHRSELTPMTWSELADLATAGWELGSHTRTHPHLTSLRDEELELELRRSREDCEERLGRPCRTLAYPYGDHDSRVISAAGRAGYHAAATLTDLLPRPATRLRWPRIGVYHVDDPLRFRLKVSQAVRSARRRMKAPGPEAHGVPAG